MSVTLDPILEKTAKALGYQSAVDFARIELRHQAAQKLTYFQGRADLYEQKYGMTLQEFAERVPNQGDISLKRFGIIEKEDDLMDWESSEHSLLFYRQQLDLLTNGFAVQ
jgi:hypothetical protein